MKMYLKDYNNILRWLFQNWKGYRIQAILNTILGILLVFADLAFVWCTKVAVDIATGVNHGALKLWHVMLFLVCVVVAQVSMTIANRWIRAILGVRGQNRMQERLFARILFSDWQKLRKLHTGNVVNRLEQDVTVVMTLLTEHIPSLFATLLRFAGAFILLFYMDRNLAIIVVFIAPIFAICSKLYVNKMRQINHEVRDAESVVQSIIQESLQNSLVLKTLECIPLQESRLRKSHSCLRGRVVESTKYSSLSVAFMNSAFALGYLIAFFWGVYGLQSGRITFGALIAFIQLVSQVQQPVRTLTRFIPVIITSCTAAERLMEIETIPREYKVDSSSNLPCNLHSRVHLVVDRISFTYDSKKSKAPVEIFHDFYADFPSGSITAVCGPTGGGKTTLISLLLGLLHPTSGSIKASIDGSPYFELSANSRFLFSYVPQGNTLMSGTIRENLQLGNPCATDEEMETALKMAEAGFVFDTPEGLDLICGERGGGLSEGQAQRVGLARALLHQSPILILDEAFSALDSETATAAVSNITKAYPGRSIIYITHREALLPFAKQIIRV